MAEADATEKPSRVRMNGSVIEAKPVLIPEGRTRKKNVDGAVDSRRIRAIETEIAAKASAIPRHG